MKTVALIELAGFAVRDNGVVQDRVSEAWLADSTSKTRRQGWPCRLFLGAGTTASGLVRRPEVVALVAAFANQRGRQISLIRHVVLTVV